VSPIVDADSHLSHYGTPRKSGRYPWGSGGSETTRNREFLDAVDNLRKQGLKDTEIARGFGMTTTQFRARRTMARNEKNLHLIQQAQRLKDKGMSNSAIGRQMNLNESRIRDLLKPGAERKANVLTQTADMLKREVEKKTYLDVGSGVELDLPIGEGGSLGISAEKFKTAVAMLEEQGYKVHTFPVTAIGTGLHTNFKVLTKDNVETGEVRRNKHLIKRPNEKTEDGGETWDNGPNPPKSFPSKRVKVRYAEKGGATEDEIIHVRPGVKALDMGEANYAQVRIAIDGTHY